MLRDPFLQRVREAVLLAERSSEGPALRVAEHMGAIVKNLCVSGARACVPSHSILSLLSGVDYFLCVCVCVHPLPLQRTMCGKWYRQRCTVLCARSCKNTPTWTRFRCSAVVRCAGLCLSVLLFFSFSFPLFLFVLFFILHCFLFPAPFRSAVLGQSMVPFLMGMMHVYSDSTVVMEHAAAIVYYLTMDNGASSS